MDLVGSCVTTVTVSEWVKSATEKMSVKTIRTSWNVVSLHGSHTIYKEMNKGTVVFVNGYYFQAITCL